LKKTLSILAFFILFSSALFAVEFPLSLGLGGSFGIDSSVISADLSDTIAKQSYSSYAYGLLIFFDMRFAEIGMGFSGLSTTVNHSESFRKATGIDPEEMTLSGNTLFLSLYGKYPFQLSSSLSLYPLVGIEAEIVMSMRYGSDSLYGARIKGDSYQGNADDWTAVWFRFGIGSDFHLNEGVFLRSELTFGIKANTPREKAIISAITKQGDYTNISSYGIGGKLTISVGYTFKTLGQGGGSAYSSGSNADVYYPR
jgi:hypothetical protein